VYLCSVQKEIYTPKNKETMKNAKITIIKSAEALIEKLVVKETKRLEDIKEGYLTFLSKNPIDEASGYYRSDSITTVTRVRQYCLVSNFDTNAINQVGQELYRTFSYNRSAQRMEGDINLSMNEKGFESYITYYRESNKVKLVRAIEKYITEEMTISGKVLVQEGSKGVEVLAKVNTIDGPKTFKTNAIFAGGYIQCYHYRYRGGLLKR